MSFHAEAFGKWILAGEHAVLRGSPALVFPVRNFKVAFRHEVSAQPMDVEFLGVHGQELKLIFWGLIENALQKLDRSRTELKGTLRVESSLPLGGGLGASAALCVGVSRFFSYLGWVSSQEVYEFARDLEGLFHGESSGVDIAVALEGHGLRFMRGGERTRIRHTWWPRFYLSYSGKRGVTSDCVKQVNELRARSPILGDQIDAQMRRSVEKAEKALLMPGDDGFQEMAEALNCARDCFVQWGLCEGELETHMRELQRAGAAALKPTGSGGGGYVLSLWRQVPPIGLRNKMIELPS